MRASLRIKTLQRVDKQLGPAACLLLQPVRWLRRRSRRPVSSPGQRPHKVLLIKFWGIGSLQLLTPAVRSLRRARPGAELVLLTLAANGEFARSLGAFDRVVTLDVTSAGWRTVLARIVRRIVELRRERFDEVFDFEFFTRFSALVTVLSGAPRSHGFAAPSVWRGGFHTRTTPFNRYWHVARNFRLLAGGEDGRNVAAGDLAPQRFGDADERSAREVLARHGIDGSRPYAVLNPNAGELSLERRWPRAMFAELARRLAHEERLAVVLVGSASERAYTQGVAELCGPARPANLAGELGVGELGALLARCAVFVTNDSGPMHLAAALGAPTLGLFGPETPVMYAPLGVRTRALYRPPACSPCINVHDNKVASCIFGSPQCLVGISVDEVFGAARAFVRGEELDELVLVPHAPHASHSPSERAHERSTQEA